MEPFGRPMPQLERAHYPKLPPPPRDTPGQIQNSRLRSPARAHLGRHYVGRRFIGGKTEFAEARPIQTRRRGSPATPVVELIPSGVASAKACASLSEVAGGARLYARDVVEEDERIERIGERFDQQPTSPTEFPAMLWPPPRTASNEQCSRANRTARIMSAAPLRRTTAPGWRLIIAFQIVQTHRSLGPEPGRHST